MPRSKDKPAAKRGRRATRKRVVALPIEPAIYKPVPGHTLVTVELESDLVDRIKSTLALRGTNIETYVRLQLRAFRSVSTPLTLGDKLTFGKYVGEGVEDVCRADPAYVRWVVGSSVSSVKFDIDVLRLLDELQIRDHDNKKNAKNAVP